MPSDPLPREVADVYGDPDNLSDEQRAERDRLIVGAKLRGIGDRTLADTFGISDRRVRQIIEAWRAENPTLRHKDPLDIVDDLLDQYQGAADELAQVAAAAKKDSDRIASIRARVDTLGKVTDLLQATGVLPHDLGDLRVQLDVRWTTETLVTVLEAHRGQPVDDALLEKLAGALTRAPTPANAN